MTMGAVYPTRQDPQMMAKETTNSIVLSNSSGFVCLTLEGCHDSAQVLVVPAFEAFSNETSVPHSKTDLRTLWRSGDVGPYL